VLDGLAFCTAGEVRIDWKSGFNFVCRSEKSTGKLRDSMMDNNKVYVGLHKAMELILELFF
jgi:hypothetical protein